MARLSGALARSELLHRQTARVLTGKTHRVHLARDAHVFLADPHDVDPLSAMSSMACCVTVVPG